MSKLLDHACDLQGALDALYRLRAAMIETGGEPMRTEALDLALTRDDRYQRAHWAFRATLDGLDSTAIQDAHHRVVALAVEIGWRVGVSTTAMVQRGREAS